MDTGFQVNLGNLIARFMPEVSLSQKGINPRYFKKVVTLERRSATRDSTGDLTEVWNTIQTLIPCTIQNLLVTEIQQLNQGREFNADYKAYLPNDIVDFINGDRLTDNDGNVFTIVGSEVFTSANNRVNIGHHAKLFLRIIKAAKT